MSLTSLPEAGAVCQELLGRPVTQAEPILQGRNSRVFRVALAAGNGLPAESVVLKFYRRDPGDERDRLGVEFGALNFLWQNSVRAVPRPVLADRSRNCAVYEYIEGRLVNAPEIQASDISASVVFLDNLRRLSSLPGTRDLPAASEACFSIADIIRSIEERLSRLRGPGLEAEQERLRAWLDREFVHVMAEVRRWLQSAARGWQIDPDEPLPAASRTLSPSDFGFHNAIRRPDGALAFVDFEYFGWDDPAKTVVDYLLHPGMALAEPFKHQFARAFLDAFGSVPRLAARARLVYPLFGLKWCLIILNDFLPERFAASSSDIRARQFAKAQALLAHIAGSHAANPYLA